MGMDNSRSSAHPSAMFFGGNRLVDDKTKRFDLGGFEPTKVTLAKREERQKVEQEKAERKRAAAQEAKKVVVNKAAPTVPKVNERYPPFRLAEVGRKKPVPDGPRGDEQYMPLRPGESLWDPNMDPRRYSNLLGGWGKPPANWRRNK
ncbi:hypothetical protein J4E93_001127 [Alternaria ventricosa]|uniref:uncharacterized protein n=1 Tax=Alternaria ventricosa TaxID=1187951 RepID=UPI0020C4A329|nr:uncharacterized protein J4E93_001127 [Alternaria ventricosa]KAI4653361.1 hypothetical protein J4E93_001127 [Alternaria ventricosa]